MPAPPASVSDRFQAGASGMEFNYPRIAEYFTAKKYSASPLFAVLIEFWKWIADGKCYIVNERSETVPLTPNDHQREIFQHMLWQAARGLPIRLIILKSRKAGASTLIQALFYFCARRIENYRVTTVAHTKDDTRVILQISKTIHKHDPDKRPLVRQNVNEMEFEHGSVVSIGASGGHYTGSGGTPFALHLSELSKWVGDEDKVIGQMQSLLNALPTENVSICIIESTSNMSSSTPEFEDRFRKAVRGESNFIPVFGAWWMKPSCRIEGATVAEKNPYEADLVRRYKLSDPQLAWYRLALMEKANGLVTWMRQDFPSTWIEAFQSALGKIFPVLEQSAHDRDLSQLEKAGFLLRNAEVYRGIDFGGAHPFATVWCAHWPGARGFSIDVGKCPRLWDELTHYSWDKHGRPRKDWDHAIDALRYVLTSELLDGGYTHVFQELYVERAADRGYTESRLAKLVASMSRDFPTAVSSRADRSRSLSINEFNDQGVACEGQTRYSGLADLGEVRDGIGYMNNIFDSGPLIELIPPPPDDPMGNHARIRQGAALNVGLTDELWGRSAGPSKKRHPIFGNSY